MGGFVYDWFRESFTFFIALIERNESRAARFSRVLK